MRSKDKRAPVSKPAALAAFRKSHPEPIPTFHKFLALPLELRRQIYRHHYAWLRQERKVPKGFRTPCIDETTLLFANRQIHREAFDIFCDHHRWRIRDGEASYRFANQVLRRFKDYQLSSIKHLSFAIQLVGTFKYEQKYWGDLFRMFETYPELRWLETFQITLWNEDSACYKTSGEPHSLYGITSGVHLNKILRLARKMWGVNGAVDSKVKVDLVQDPLCEGVPRSMCRIPCLSASVILVVTNMPNTETCSIEKLREDLKWLFWNRFIAERTISRRPDRLCGHKPRRPWPPP